MDNYKHSELTDKVIKAFYKVYNKLGFGFLEKVYENALCIELRNLGFEVKKQQPIEVFYADCIVGKYFADLVIKDTLIIELKAAKTLCYQNECQLVNYLKATNIEVGLLLNFGESPQIKRKVYTNGPRINLID